MSKSKLCSPQRWIVPLVLSMQISGGALASPEDLCIYSESQFLDFLGGVAAGAVVAVTAAVETPATQPVPMYVVVLVAAMIAMDSPAIEEVKAVPAATPPRKSRNCDSL